MNITLLDPPVWVDTPPLLEQMMENLSKARILAVDTESNSLYAYREQVCLLQISTESVDYLIDPLSPIDLSPLDQIFNDPWIQKVFHAAEYDIICLKRDFGFSFTNLFDTMLAGRILGKERLGLGSMLEEQFGLLLDKRFQRANWGKRPLTPEQMEYARLDTHCLFELRKYLYQELQNIDRLKLAEEDFARMCQVEVPPLNGDEGICWRVAGNQNLTLRQMTVLRELCLFRERMAESNDVPPFKIFGNQTLLLIAQYCPRTVDQLEKIHALSEKQFARYAEGVTAAVREGMKAHTVQRPTKTPRVGNYLNRLDVLREWRKKTGRISGVESDVILPKDIMEEIATANPKTKDDLRRVMQSVPWRFKQYGEEILLELQQKT